MINVILFMHIARSAWRFEANVAKCAVVVFRNERTFDGEWFLGGLHFATSRLL